MNDYLYEQVERYLNIDNLSEREIKIIDYVKRYFNRSFKQNEDNFNFD